MNIHEYQAKALFEKFGVPVPKGAVATTPEEFINALSQLPAGRYPDHVLHTSVEPCLLCRSATLPGTIG